MMWSGPLPPPQALAAFNDVVPNGAERIMAAWESETAHRHKVESREQLTFAIDTILGKVFALIFVLAALAVCGYSAYVGAQWVAGIIGTGVIASVVWAFVKVNKHNKD